MVSRKAMAPDQGDVVWLDHNPQAGHEQAGRRPALVLSPKAYNAATGLMLCCPITSQVKGYPFEVSLIGVKGVQGVVLSDQVRSLDWEARGAEKTGRAADDVVMDVLAKLKVLLPMR
jgi:mRNA interferase MazF